MIIRRLSKAYGSERGLLPVLDDFSLEVEPGTIVALVGPSGCGKTTLLRLVGDLESADGGEILRSEAESGPIGYLFQEPRLLPWHTVLSNVELVLRSWMPDKRERLDRAMEFISLVGLADFARFKPDELSGGMRQRVAIARAFAYPGRLMLLDEPFQSLDSALRWSLVDVYLTLWQTDRRTTVYVTHDVPEALLLADAVVKLSERPMRVLDRIEMEIPREDRSLGDPQMVRLQARLYT